MAAPHTDRQPVTFGDVLRIREFRALWLADLQSWIGDQIGRVALSVLVFERTGSAAATALVYGLTYLPAVLGGVLLGGLADRVQPRQLMIACNAGRAVLFAVMALPAVPIPAVAALLVAAVLLGPPFTAAEGSLLPRILEGERYVVATGLRMASLQGAQLAGFGFGGLLIGLVGSRWGLALDALTFAVAAVAVRFVVADRPPANGRSDVAGLAAYLRSVPAAARSIAADPTLRFMLGFGWLAACFVVPEGLAAPYAHAIGGGPGSVGLLLAAAPAGTAVASALFVRRVSPGRRSALIGPLAIAAGLPLGACAVHPGLAVSLVLWFVSGAGSAYQVAASATFVQAAPDERRGQVVGLAASGLIAIQGVGIMVAGLVAEQLGPATTIALAGALGVALAAALAVRMSRTTLSGSTRC